MAFLGAAARAGLAAVGSSGKPGRRRRRGKPSRKLTTSQLAIRRAEARRKRGGSGPSPDRGPRRVKGTPVRSGPSRGPSRPTRGRTTRSINTGSRRRSPLSRALRGRMQKGRCK